MEAGASVEELDVGAWVCCLLVVCCVLCWCKNTAKKTLSSKVSQRFTYEQKTTFMVFHAMTPIYGTCTIVHVIFSEV